MDTKEYDKEFIFKKLKKREANKPKKIIIGEPIKIDLEVINLGVVE